MKEDPNIWQANGGAPGLSDEQLLAYLEGRMPEDECRALEEALSSEGIDSDALEGLRTLQQDEIRGLRRALHTALWQRVGRRRRPRHKVAVHQWILMALVLLLILCVACFLVFWRMKL